MIPLKMQMINFGPYEDSTVNFNFKSVLIVGENSSISGASNGTGKSTIFQALTWVLTGNSRYKNSNSIIRDGTESAKVILLFKVGDEHYQIARGRNRSNKQTLDFNKISADGKLEPVKADTNSKLDDKIAAVTHVRYDSFVNTAYFAQNTISEFMYGTSSVRQKLIAEILSMDRWNSYAKRAATHLADTEKDLDVLRYRLSGMNNLDQQRATITVEEQTAAELVQSLEHEMRELQDDEDGLRDLAAAEQAAINSQAARSTIISLIESTRRNIADCEKRLVSANTKLASLREERLPLKVPEELGARPDASSSITQKLAERRGELQLLQRRMLVIERGECDTCGSSWKHDHSSELQKIKTQIDELRTRISVGESKLVEARTAESDWDLRNTSRVSMQARISALDTEISRCDKDIEDFRSRISNSEGELSSAEHKLSKIPDASVEGIATAKLKEIRTRLEGLRNKYSAALATRSTLAAKLELINKQHGELASLNARREELEKEVNLYSALTKHFSKTGIQASILDTVVSEIEVLSNSFLARLSHKPFSIRFITQKPDTKGQLKETLDVEVISPSGVKYIEDLSGGEQFRVAFSIRLALAAVQARRQGGELTLLLLDEVSSSLDKVGIETFVSIVKELQKTMIVMLITHDDSLKEHFDNVIKVRSDGQIAKVIQ